MTHARTIAILFALISSAILTGAAPLDAEAAAVDAGDFDQQGLTPREVALLWSGDDEAAASPQVDIYDHFPDTEVFESNLSMARQTDIVYQTPPEHAGTWTKNAFQDLGSGQFSTASSLHPAGANTVDEGVIRDAHATVYTASPSTILHRGDGTQRYIGPSGKVRALVDYRVEDRSGYVDNDPAGEDLLRREVSWELTASTIQAERLYAGSQLTGKKSDGLNLNGKPSHKPTFTYSSGDGVDELRVEADIKVSYRRVETTTHRERSPVQNPLDNDTEYIKTTETEFGTVTDTVTVSDSISVEVYRVADGFEGWTASSPDGTARYAVSLDHPWAGYRVEAGSNGVLDDKQTSNRVHTRWKFFTARPSSWQSLESSDASGTDDVSMLVPPAAVHAFPAAQGSSSLAESAKTAYKVSSLNDGEVTVENASAGPIRVDDSVEPSDSSGGLDVQQDPLITDSWGSLREGVTLRPEIRVGEATSQHEAMATVSARHPTLSAGKSVRVYGILPGSSKRVSSGKLQDRTIREANLSLSVAEFQNGNTTLRVTIRDNTTDERVPLRYPDSSRYELLEEDEGLVPDDLGRIEITHSVTGETWEVRPANGTTTLTVPYDGSFRAEYQPASWIVADPAYQSAWATAKSGSFADVLDIGPQMAAVVVFLIACWVPWKLSAKAARIVSETTDNP